ncbi:hypothetical protein EV644_14624 [Kribbella orskensis]|uniref:Uncharacterized protein n=1 Tax=Kribbella orskensis TaxID=2512216 RepID=A0ABY2B6W0_9ACTN|nr:hypothetical protein EV642_14924 [Kribbella sp. VKM Ac-2500]TCO08533.1 hypothetical protein EV644_14624 [Kribbella orskensis]
MERSYADPAHRVRAGSGGVSRVSVYRATASTAPLPEAPGAGGPPRWSAQRPPPVLRYGPAAESADCPLPRTARFSHPCASRVRAAGVRTGRPSERSTPEGGVPLSDSERATPAVEGLTPQRGRSAARVGAAGWRFAAGLPAVVVGCPLGGWLGNPHQQWVTIAKMSARCRHGVRLGGWWRNVAGRGWRVRWSLAACRAPAGGRPASGHHADCMGSVSVWLWRLEGQAISRPRSQLGVRGPTLCTG